MFVFPSVRHSPLMLERRSFMVICSVKGSTKYNLPSGPRVTASARLGEYIQCETLNSSSRETTNPSGVTATEIFWLLIRSMRYSSVQRRSAGISTPCHTGLSGTEMVIRITKFTLNYYRPGYMDKSRKLQCCGWLTESEVVSAIEICHITVIKSRAPIFNSRVP